ncbi:N-acetylmannosamine-6-phosphate 2-epimerase [Gloeocapsa sp. PCC 73106]|uniref:N-acetylmannosamine-6-phosphate 2-epimerase n=1 Tax=Gloeocapsa sp. PCC 73106 TaxID=102232 RepID=UPI0002AC2862|nr:N-acetylmannosamine-6-phosphate 2-epimerase [Gloeocapsa sp. PCC 73106]ELR99607.1 putative N-acetylmannosamine-6-phosphate epimerase [Gloeocapsa sp. PCC 73106]
MKTELLASLKSRLIVSCQAPPDSPLNHPQVIAAIAHACVNQGAVGLRINGPNHVQAVKEVLPHIPVIGLWKRTYPNSPVYITPTRVEVEALIKAGADIIALDATLRKRPQETVEELIQLIHSQDRLIMADIDTLDSAIAAATLGADLIATTLYGYTSTTEGLTPPGFPLLKSLSTRISTPIICEGGISSREMVHKALELGAYGIVVGTAITGIEQKVRDFCPQYAQ